MGLRLVKDKYPNYKDITLIFHDVDSIPNTPSLFPYKTSKGTVSHYYGFKFVLGFWVWAWDELVLTLE